MTIGPPNMASTVERFAFPVDRYRYVEATTDSHGLSVTPAPDVETITAHLYPAPGEVVDRLPEGQRDRATIAGSVSGDVRAANYDAGVRGDLLRYDGRLWEVVQVGPYSSGSLGARTWRTIVAQYIDREVDP